MTFIVNSKCEQGNISAAGDLRNSRIEGIENYSAVRQIQLTASQENSVARIAIAIRHRLFELRAFACDLNVITIMIDGTWSNPPGHRPGCLQRRTWYFRQFAAAWHADCPLNTFHSSAILEQVAIAEYSTLPRAYRFGKPLATLVTASDGSW